MTQGDIGTDSIPANCYCITFKEEQAGYLAGYAVTKDASWAASLFPPSSATATATSRASTQLPRRPATPLK